jgi:hypothetical protein
LSLVNTRRSIINTQPVVDNVDKSKSGFNLYFAGSQNKIAERYLQDIGCNRLASQLADRVVINAWIAARDRGASKGHLFIDSGAFSAHTRNAEVDVDAYIDYLNGMDDQLHIFAQVDKIPEYLDSPKQESSYLKLLN